LLIYRNDKARKAGVYLGRTKFLGALFLWLLGTAAAQAQTNIPLQLVTVPGAPGSAYQRLVINVGVGGGAPHPYLFDTGSALFNAPAAFIGSTDSILADGASYTYGDGNGYYGDLATVPSISFYAPGASTPVATETAGSAGYVVNEVQDHLLGNNPGGGAQPITIYNPSNHQYTTYWIQPTYPNNINNAPPLEGIIYGTFGAGDFTTIVNNGTAPGTSKYTNVAVGSILGQSTTSGYVVAANGTAGQNVTNCSPCVMLGLTPALLAQFRSIEPWDLGSGIGTAKFPVSGANSSTEFGVEFEYTATYQGHQVVFSGPSLLDTGTQDLNFHTDQDVSALETEVEGYLNAGATVTMTGYAPGSVPVGFTATDALTALQTFQISLGTDKQIVTTNLRQTAGIGFFLENSVLYNLAGEETGYSPNFVTDQNITTPFDVTVADGPLGLAGVISGSGGVTLESGTSATLSGTNLYTGATNVAAGAELLLVGPGSIAGSSGVVDDGVVDTSGETLPVTQLQGLTGNGTVYLGANSLQLTNANGTFSGQLEDGGLYGGSGGALVVAGGNEVLTGSSDYTGGTLVEGGAVLEIGSDAALGATTGGLTLNSGTLVALGDITTQRAVTVGAAGGTLNAGNNAVTLNGLITLTGPLVLNGNVAPGAGATSVFEINAPGSYGRLIKPAGSFMLNGTLLPVLNPGNTPPGLGQVFNLVSAPGGLQGHYILTLPQTSPGPGLRLDALTSPTALDLVTTPAAYADLPAAGVPETANESAVGATLDAIRPAAGAALGTGAALFTPLYQQSAAGVPVALAQLAPAIAADALMVRRNAWDLTGQAVGGQLAAARGAWFEGQPEAAMGAGGGVWLTGLGQTGSIGGGNAPSYQGTLSGFAAGADMPLGKVRAGAAVSYVNGTGSDQAGAQYSGDGVTGLAYAGLRQGIAFVDATFGGGVFESGTTQTIGFAATQTSGHSTGTDLGGSLATGVDLGSGDWQVEPSLKLTAAQFWQAGYQARAGNALYDLSLAPAAITSVQTQLGAWLQRRVALQRGWALLPDVQAGWLHEYADEDATVTGQYAGLGAGPFNVQSAAVGRDAAVLGAGAVLQSAGSLALFLNYTGEVNGQSNAQNFSGGVRMNW